MAWPQAGIAPAVGTPYAVKPICYKPRAESSKNNELKALLEIELEAPRFWGVPWVRGIGTYTKVIKGYRP